MAGELDALKNAAQGLLYPSESDEPFEVMAWKQEPRLGGQIQSLDDFFAALEGSEEEDRFQSLRRVIERNLRGVSVHRVGEVEVDVYIVGKTAAGEWLGLRTRSIET